MPPPPPISHVLETCLYVRDLVASTKFYRDTLQIEPFLESSRVSGFPLGQTTLLLFQIGGSDVDIQTPTGVIPGHGPTKPLSSKLLLSPSSSSSSSSSPGNNDDEVKLKQHFCLAVANPEDVMKWDEHLQNVGAKIRGRMEWERGGRSVYFEDLDGHVGEVGSRGIWAHYPLE